MNLWILGQLYFRKFSQISVVRESEFAQIIRHSGKFSSDIWFALKFSDVICDKKKSIKNSIRTKLFQWKFGLEPEIQFIRKSISKTSHRSIHIRCKHSWNNFSTFLFKWNHIPFVFFYYNWERETKTYTVNWFTLKIVGQATCWNTYTYFLVYWFNKKMQLCFTIFFLMEKVNLILTTHGKKKIFVEIFFIIILFHFS